MRGWLQEDIVLSHAAREGKFELEMMEHLLNFWNKNSAPFTRRQAQLISQVHGEETPITGVRRLESVRD